jgi:hypothetical protein
MKRIFFLTFGIAIIYFGCTKKNDQPSTTTTQNAKPKTLVANAGLDTTICMPYGGTGNMFKAILDGRASYDGSGNIVSYVWTEVFPNAEYSSPIVVGSKALTEVEISDPGINGSVHTFRLEVKDDHGQVDDHTVIINVNKYFEYEYDGLSWDSTVGATRTISENFKPGLIESWPDFTNAIISQSGAYISNYNGKCNDISKWNWVPYVPYDSIQLTNISLFYTLIAVRNGIVFPEIFAKTNSGIDFNQKVSIGFNVGIADPWDNW